MRVPVVVVVLLAVVGLPLQAAGQALPESLLRPGVKVRYRVPHGERPFTGVLEQADTTSLTVRPDGTDLLVRLGLDTLRSLAVLHRLRSSAEGAGRGAIAGLEIGVLAGAAATTLVWLSSADERCDDCFISATASTAVLSVIGTLALSLLGGALGASAPGEIWNDVPVGASRRRGVR